MFRKIFFLLLLLAQTSMLFGQATCSCTLEGNVISKDKTVFPSSTLVGTADAKTLTNGDAAAKAFPNVWSTEFGSRETDFVEIDLEKIQPISSVRLLGRNDCGSQQWCMDRMLYVRIELLSETTAEAITYFSLNNPKTIANNIASAATAQSGMEESAAKAFSRFGNDPKNGKYVSRSNIIATAANPTRIKIESLITPLPNRARTISVSNAPTHNQFNPPTIRRTIATLKRIFLTYMGVQPSFS
jgi:hypothetical protein